MKKEKNEWAFNLSVCPDCWKKQSKPKKKGDECENKYCDSYIIEYGKDKRICWWNENWG